MLIDGRRWEPATRTPEGAPADIAGSAPIRAHLGRVDDLLRRRLAAVAEAWAEPAGRVPSCPDPAVEPAIGAGSERGAIPAVIDLPGMLTDLITTGGKRLRPILAFLGFRVAGGPDGAAAEDDLIKLSAALELLHTFALVHDDVMDESTSRRGRPTAHVGMAQVHRELGGAGRSERFGENIAVLLGDLAHAEADRLVAGCRADLQDRWHTMIIELINGQVRDLAGAAGRHRDPRQALLVAQLKSGAYTIQRPLELGAAAAGGDPAVSAMLSEYGQEVGSAFALRDDILGVWGDPDVTGKPSGDDLVAGKPTVIIALAEQRLPRPGRVLLDRIGTAGLSAADVGALQRMIEECGVRAEVETMIDNHVRRALATVQRLDRTAAPMIVPATPDGSGTTGLMVRLAHQVGWRDR